MKKPNRNDYEYFKELIMQELPLEPCGKHSKTIALNTGIDSRTVRQVIMMMRDDGIPVCSNPTDGYWIAQRSTEIQEVINMINSYIAGMQDTVESLTQAKINKMKEEGLL